MKGIYVRDHYLFSRKGNLSYEIRLQFENPRSYLNRNISAQWDEFHADEKVSKAGHTFGRIFSRNCCSPPLANIGKITTFLSSSCLYFGDGSAVSNKDDIRQGDTLASLHSSRKCSTWSIWSLEWQLRRVWRAGARNPFRRLAPLRRTGCNWRNSAARILGKRRR
jgi:hypothetical protein